MTYQQRLARQAATGNCAPSFPYGFEAYAKALIQIKHKETK